jgi:nuclear pore complex protein Nup205
MDGIDLLGGLRGLYQDLSTISEASIPNIERLCMELEAHLDDFRKLLNKAPKNNASRQAVLSGRLPQQDTSTHPNASSADLRALSGKITIGEVEYAINSDFQQGTLQLADALNLDELEAAALFMSAQEDAQQLDRTPLITAIMQFHERRHFLLECLRLIFQESFDVEREEIQQLMQNTVAHILETKSGTFRNASLFARKCLSSMEDTEKWLSLLGEQVQKASIVGQAEDVDIMEAIEYQRSSLGQQHESLGAILCYLFKGNFTSSEDFRLLLDRVRKLERFDMLLVHYLPAIVASLVQYGSPEGSASQREARSLHSAITSSSSPWVLGPFHAAVIAWWLAVYSGWYFDSGPASPLQGIDLEKESEERTKLFMNALDDAALEFTLAICAGVNSDEWRDPARSELVTLLLKESPAAILESEPCSEFLKALLMEHFDIFAESCIANMPDAVRMLKSEEDLQRLNQITALRDGLHTNPRGGIVEARTHLESFLVIMAFAFEKRHDAAQEFWADHDGNLYGFLQWASKRQTVPRVSAFCEMLCSISEGEDNATAAHRFLLEEDKHISAKFRRSTSMNWTQMFAELQLYATKVTEKPSTSQTILHTRKSEPAEMNEPESPVMLTCYLRLIGHLSKQSSAIREWMLHHPTFNIVGTLLTLCSGSIPTHLRASAFGTLKALMTDRSSAHGNEMWLSIDHWISGAAVNAPGLAKAPVLSNQPAWHERHAFQKIGESFDQTNAFVEFIHTLVTPSPDLPDQQLALPFPESLGASYRMPGIEPYVDFILGHAFARKIPDVTDSQGRLLAWNCLSFVATCLATFNENLVVIAHQPSANSDPNINSSSLNTYIRLHPFARAFEWLFNEDVIKTLFLASHQDVSEVAKASSDSILILSLVRSIEVINLILDLQSTYLNIVRPLIRTHAAPTKTNVANSALASFEDSILNNLGLIPDLCLYCGTGHQQLTVMSMALLEKLSSSRKLNKTTTSDLLTWRSPNKIVEVLSTEIDADSVARALVSQMEPDPREIEYGPLSSGYLIREGLLGLLNSCLDMITDRPTVAHLLLGFSCVGNVLDVSADGLFANGMSLLHAIINFMQIYPTEIDGSITSWTVHAKRIAFEVLRHLWSSRLSSSFTLIELRMNRFLLTSFASQPIIRPNTLWDNLPSSTPEFWLSDSATSLSEFLVYRSHLFDYAVTEIRSAAKLGSKTLQLDILSTLLGSSSIETGETILNPTVFDLFDFADLDLSGDFNPPPLNILTGIDFELCAKPQADDSPVLYDLDAAQELIQLKRKELVQSGRLRAQDEEPFQIEVENVLAFLRVTNQKRQIRYNRYLAIRSWSELATVMIISCDMEGGRRTTFILQAIQLILPKLEVSIVDNVPEAIELARLAETLISNLEPATGADHSKRGGDVIDEKLYQLFQVSIRGISLAVGNVVLRESFYNTCAHYLSRITSPGSTHKDLRRHSQQTVKTAGAPLVEAVCDDAYAGQETCRVSAFLLLNLLAALDSRENSFILADAISQYNYLSMFLDALKALPSEFRDAQASGESDLLFV